MAEFEHPPGATPIDPDEAQELLLAHITNRAELNRWEHDNIRQAEQWAFRYKPNNLLSVDFILKLHKKMFEIVWGWAGTFRRSGKNIGVDALMVRTSLVELLEDVKAWIDHDTYSADEIATRFHHRLVLIHPFPNGNGRHARLMTDLILVHVLDRPRFTWGSTGLTNAEDCRTNYINALKSADRHEYDLLLTFVRS